MQAHEDGGERKEGCCGTLRYFLACRPFHFSVRLCVTTKGGEYVFPFIVRVVTLYVVDVRAFTADWCFLGLGSPKASLYPRVIEHEWGYFSLALASPPSCW